MTFRLKITLGNAAMLTGHDVAAALRRVAHTVMQTNPHAAAKYAQVAPVFDKARSFPHIYAKLVDLCMRVAA